MRTTVVKHVSTFRHDEWGGPKRYIKVVVHRTRGEMQRAAAKYALRENENDAFYQYALACFQPAPDREIYDKKTDSWRSTTDKHYAGLLRLVKGYVGAEVVAHECVHAAAHIWRRDVTHKAKKPVVNLGDDCGWREEGFAYLVGDLTGGVMLAVGGYGDGVFV